VTRVVHATTPVRVEYRLTAKGQSLGPVLDTIGAWARTWVVLEEAGAAERA